MSYSLTIASGTSVSEELFCGGFIPTMVIMPASWTAANLTFQIKDDAGTWHDLYDSSGTEVTATAAASRAIGLTPSTFFGAAKIRIRSGTTSVPVNQGAARILMVDLSA